MQLWKQTVRREEGLGFFPHIVFLVCRACPVCMPAPRALKRQTWVHMNQVASSQRLGEQTGQCVGTALGTCVWFWKRKSDREFVQVCDGCVHASSLVRWLSSSLETNISLQKNEVLIKWSSSPVCLRDTVSKTSNIQSVPPTDCVITFCLW